LPEGNFSAAENAFVAASRFDALLHESVVSDAVAVAKVASDTLPSAAAAFESVLVGARGLGQVICLSPAYWRIKSLGN